MKTLVDVAITRAPHQPNWADPALLSWVREKLLLRPALIAAADVRRLRLLLGRVAAEEALVIQSGDCAEDPGECGQEHIRRKEGLLDALAGALKMVTQKPVLRVGRIAGQFAKPRSRPTEVVNGVELPAYLGHLVNRPDPDPVARRHDASHLLTGYDAANEAMTHLGWLGRPMSLAVPPTVWTSHEALVLDYELALVRRDEDGNQLLASTHWPWIGERTRQVDGVHIGLLAGVVNPVGCKVGPHMTPDELTALCQQLDPWREPGRLTLISRIGADRTAVLLPPLVRAVRAAGHPVIWLVDPMHGNTTIAPDGRKVRCLDVMMREVRAFRSAVRQAGGVAGGLHLETTPENVTECVADERAIRQVRRRYTSLCDPRLNPGQAMAVVSAWAD